MFDPLSKINHGHILRSPCRVCNIVSENPRTREKKPWKQVQGMGGLRFWDFKVYRTGTRRFSSHMVFLGNFLADPKTRKCHFNNQKTNKKRSNQKSIVREPVKSPVFLELFGSGSGNLKVSKSQTTHALFLLSRGFFSGSRVFGNNVAHSTLIKCSYFFGLTSS